MRKPNKRALRKSVWAAISKLVSVMLAAGAGSLIYHLIGTSSTALSIDLAIIFSVAAFFLIWFAEYEKENDDL